MKMSQMNKLYLKVVFFLLFSIVIGKLYSSYVSVYAKEEFVENKVSGDLNTSKKEFLEVFIDGAVKKPGKYKIEKNSRLYDLVDKAGGYKKNAYKKVKNYFLKNGSKFTIKYRKKILVEILGEIKKPGQYILFQGDKLYKLIKKAGGVTKVGYTPKKNYYLKNGMKFYIYKRRK